MLIIDFFSRWSSSQLAKLLCGNYATVLAIAMLSAELCNCLNTFSHIGVRFLRLSVFYVFLPDECINLLTPTQSGVLVAQIISGVARPGPTRACALPSTFQALLSPINLKLCNSTKDQTEEVVTNCMMVDVILSCIKSCACNRPCYFIMVSRLFQN